MIGLTHGQIPKDVQWAQYQHAVARHMEMGNEIGVPERRRIVVPNDLPVETPDDKPKVKPRPEKVDPQKEPA